MIARETAETIGVQAAAWLAGQDDLLMTFLSSTGASVDDFKSGLQDPAFQGSVLDFILMDDTWVKSFCDETGLGYDMPMQARLGLPGGEQVSWT